MENEVHHRLAKLWLEYGSWRQVAQYLKPAGNINSLAAALSRAFKKEWISASVLDALGYGHVRSRFKTSPCERVADKYLRPRERVRMSVEFESHKQRQQFDECCAWFGMSRTEFCQAIADGELNVSSARF